MRFLLFILIILEFFAGGSESPHGEKLKPDCSACHTSSGWAVDLNSMSFNHNSTGFALEGQHGELNCKLCHSSLIFEEAKMKTSCVDCHTDVHQQTVGFDCAQCHNSKSWIIENTMNLHRQSRFPLMGIHALTDCNRCHVSAPNLRFESIGIDCYDCHKETFMSTTQPNHIEEGYSTNCTECHSPKSYEWSGAGFNHDFFPLLGGHKIPSCNDCHGDDLFSSISANCMDCHLADFEQTTNPKHDPVSFSTQCDVCHTTNPGWKPADYRIHDSNSFPIYTGKHQGEWKKCTDCHANENNYAQFSCIDCHEHNKSSMDREHNDERNYAYQSSACFDCHPRGRAEDD